LVLFVILLVLIWTNCKATFPKDLGGIELRKGVCDRIGKAPKSIKPLSDSLCFWAKKLSKVKFDTTFKLANVLFTCPVSLLLACGFLLRGSVWVERLAFLHSAIFTYTMIVVSGYLYDSLLQATASLPVTHTGPTDTTVAALVFGFYTFFPLAVIVRLWNPQPFVVHHQCGMLRNVLVKVLQVALIIWFTTAFIAFYEFSAKNVKSCAGLPSMVDPLMRFWNYFGTLIRI
jgi:hypothetical protein